MKKMPWGIAAGILAMIVFWLTLAVVAAFMILNQIAMQTHVTTTIFGTWWQTLLFVADIVAAAGALFCLAMYIRGKIVAGRAAETEVAKDEA